MTPYIARIILFIVLIVVLWDVIVTYSGRPEASLSQVILEKSMRDPIIPFLIGVIIGHLFWTNRYDFNTARSLFASSSLTPVSPVLELFRPITLGDQSRRLFLTFFMTIPQSLPFVIELTYSFQLHTP